MRYVSTRGEAPPLGFVEAMLAGLARDGGLYVPAAWPRLDAQAISGFAGRRYGLIDEDVRSLRRAWQVPQVPSIRTGEMGWMFGSLCWVWG